MNHSTIRSLLLGATAVATCAIAPAAWAQSQFTFDLPAQPLAQSLRAVASRSGATVGFDPEVVAGLSAPALRGAYSPADALKALVAGRGLEVRSTAGGSFSVVRSRLAQGDTEAAEAVETSMVEEVIVTAGKREQALSKVPGSVSAMTGDKLEKMNASKLSDYVAFIPGLSFSASTGRPGAGALSIRGIAPGTPSATTATYVDEVPYGSSSGAMRGGLYALDLDPSDLQRIEVLKGPQGTLYGASSLGGIVKYVTRKPDLNDVEIRTGQELNSIEGGEVGYKLRGAISVPIIQDKLAARVSAFVRRDAGYTDDIGAGGDDINRADAWGARATLYFRPTDALSITVTGLATESESAGNNVVQYDPVTGRAELGDLKYQRYAKEPYELTARLLSAEINYDFGAFDLISASSFTQNRQHETSDITNDFEGFEGISPTSPAVAVAAEDFDKFTQEIRLASKQNGHFEWMVGAFYQRETIDIDTVYEKLDPQGRPIDLPIPLGERFSTGGLREKAAFVNATWYLTPSFDIGVGYRHSEIDQDVTRRQRGTGVTGGDVFLVTKREASEQADSWLATARWRIDDQTMVYARAASGYRPGGTRGTPPGAPANFATMYTSDSLWNYEIGGKYRSPDGRLTAEVAAFWIDWKDIQTLEVVGSGTVSGNAGTAISRGVEFGAQLVPIDGLTLAANLTYTDARYTEDNAAIGVFDGDQLNYTPKWAAGVQGEYAWSVFGNWDAFVGGDYRYQSKRFNVPFFGTRLELPGYGLWGLHAGLEDARFRASIYVSNLTDERGWAGYGSGGYFGIPLTMVISEPRKIGVSFSQKF
jgi:iron complex outermembrane receptor protein